MHQAERFPRHDASAAVIRRAGAHVPRVEMTADDDDFVGPLPPADFADHVRRVRVGFEVRLHLEVDANRVAAIRHALEARSIFGGDGGRRDCGLPFNVREGAGVRRPKTRGPDRTHEHGDPAKCRDPRRSCRAVTDGLAVIREGNVEEDDAAFDAIFAGVEVVKAVEDEDLGFDAVGRRADAVAETEDDQRLRCRRHDLQALAAAHPMRHLHRFGVHVLEAVAFHLLDGPADGGVEVG